MQVVKQAKTLGKERLERIIEMCLAIENHTVDPFTLDIDEIIKVVREYFPHWQNPEELRLDARGQRRTRRCPPYGSEHDCY